MIAELNRLVALVEDNLTDDLDLAGVASGLGTTEYHLRRMFSSLAGMPLSEYVRRRRMTVAAADVLGQDDLLSIAVRYGYGSTEAFGRAFRAVHGAGPSDIRRDGGPLRTQPQIRFRLTVEGNTIMDARITDRPDFRLINGSRPIRGDSGPVPPSSRSSTVRMTSASPPANSGCPSNAPEPAPAHSRLCCGGPPLHVRSRIGCYGSLTAFPWHGLGQYGM